MSDATLFDEIAMYIGTDNASHVINLLSKFAEVKVERTQEYYVMLARSKTSRDLLDTLSRSGLQSVDNKFVQLGDGFCIVVIVTPVETEMLVVIRTGGESNG